VACKSEGQSPHMPTRPRIAVYTKNMVNPNYAAFRLGAERKAAALGAEILQRVPEGADDAGEQAALLLQDLEHPPAGILFNPADDEALIPMVEKATSARIPVLNFINRMRGRFIGFIGGDEFAIGATAARHLFRSLNGAGNVVVIEGPKSA